MMTGNCDIYRGSLLVTDKPIEPHSV
jgi:hypothetical protein